MGSKLMNCCKPELVDTKEHDKMLKRIQVLEDGRAPAKEARSWRVEGEKRRITEKKVSEVFETSSRMEGFVAQKSCGILPERKVPAGTVRVLREEEKRVTTSENTRLCMKKIS